MKARAWNFFKSQGLYYRGGEIVIFPFPSPRAIEEERSEFLQVLGPRRKLGIFPSPKNMKKYEDISSFISRIIPHIPSYFPHIFSYSCIFSTYFSIFPLYFFVFSTYSFISSSYLYIFSSYFLITKSHRRRGKGECTRISKSSLGSRTEN